jgi:glycosyltransferase involved in cell wall biosynthesis
MKEIGNKTKYKILYIFNTDMVKGGGEISLLNLIENIDRVVFKPIAVVPGKGELLEHVFMANSDCYIIELPGVRHLKINLWLICITKLINLIRIEKINIIHANGSRAMLWGGIAGMVFKIPSIWHLRVADTTDWHLDRILFKLSTKVVAISSAVVNRLDRIKKNKKKILLIPNGVNLDKFSTKNRRFRNSFCSEFGLRPDKPIVLTVCQIARWKRVDVFIRAASRISKLNQDVQFVICGREVPGSEGHFIELVKLSERLGLETKLKFLGFRRDIPAIMGASDIFVLSSVGEAFGRVIIEAMASGLPVVATNSGGIPEIIEHNENGLLFKPGNHKELSNYILSLLSNSGIREKIVVGALNLVEEKYTIANHAERIQNIYYELLR